MGYRGGTAMGSGGFAGAEISATEIKKQPSLERQCDSLSNAVSGLWEAAERIERSLNRMALCPPKPAGIADRNEKNPAVDPCTIELKLKQHEQNLHSAVCKFLALANRFEDLV